MGHRSLLSLLAIVALPSASPAAWDQPPKEVWAAPATGGFYATPTVYGDSIYAGGLDNKAYCLDAQFGSVKWSFETKGKVYSGVIVADGIAYFASDDKHVYAVAAATGWERWRRELDGPVYATPVVIGGQVLIGTGASGTLYSLDAATGAIRWTYAMGDRLGSGLTVSDGLVYVPSYDGFLYVIDLQTGHVQWLFKAEGILDSRPLVTADTVYLKLPDDTVYAVGLQSHVERWRYEPTEPAAERGKLSNWSSFALADGKLLYGSKSGKLQALDAATGEPRWSYDAGDEVPAAPLVAGGIGLLGVKDGSLRALDLSDGHLLWRWPKAADGPWMAGGQQPAVKPAGELLRGIMWPPVAAGEWLYVSSLDGHLYGFKQAATEER